MFEHPDIHSRLVLPRHEPGSTVQLPDGATATVLVQRGTTVWLTSHDWDWRTARADQLVPA